MAIPANVLPPGTRLDSFTIESVLGGGGFSIVYLATPDDGSNAVVIKEYMPSSLATRIPAFSYNLVAPLKFCVSTPSMTCL